MSNCLNLIPILSRPEYRIRWTNTSDINLNFDPVTKRYLLGQSEILNIIGDLIVEERYKVTRFVIGGPAVGSWTPWARTIRLPITGAVLKFYIRTSGKNWIEIGSNGVNINFTYLQALSGLNKLEAKAVMSVPSGVFRCSSEVVTATTRNININKGVSTTTTWSPQSIVATSIRVFKTPLKFFTLLSNGGSSDSGTINLSGSTIYTRPSTGLQVTVPTGPPPINPFGEGGTLKVTSNLHPGQFFEASASFNLNLLKPGKHTLTLNYIGPRSHVPTDHEGTRPSKSAQTISLEIIDTSITFNLSACNIPSGTKPQEFTLPKFGSGSRWAAKSATEHPSTEPLTYTLNGQKNTTFHASSMVLSPIKKSSSATPSELPAGVLLKFADWFNRERASIIVGTNCPAKTSTLESYTIYLLIGSAFTVPFTIIIKR